MVILASGTIRAFNVIESSDQAATKQNEKKKGIVGQ